jgi:hypothetical protein
VTLTATTADAQAATTSARVTVTAAEKITKLKLAAHGTGVRLTIALSGPGTLTSGSNRYPIRSAGTRTFQLRLTKAQRRTLARHHKLSYSVKLTFAPTFGPTITRTARTTLHHHG